MKLLEIKNCNRKGMSNKRGMANNIMAIIIFLFVFAFITIMGYLILNEFIGVLITSGYYVGETATTGDNFLGGLKIFDYVAVLIMFALIIGIGVTNYKISAPPVFAIVQFIMAAIYGFVGYYFNFIFAEMTGSAAFTTTTLFFPKMLLICNNFHWIALISLLIGMITLYGKREEDGFLG